MINEALTAAFLVIGSLFMLLAGVGLLRMPDILMRLHATTKAGALGSGMVMIAVAVYFLDGGVTARALVVLGFILLTAPVAAHAVGRASYFVGAPLWGDMAKDELKGQYDMDTHVLHSPESFKDKNGNKEQQ